MNIKNTPHKKPTAHMIYGFVGAGKTTFAKILEKETGALRFSNDEWMIALYGDNPPAEKFADYHERVTKLLQEIAFKCLKADLDVIFDDGFWSRARRDEIRERIRKAGADFKLYHVKCTEEVMKQRTLKRTGFSEKGAFYIDKAAIETFKKRFEPLGADEEHIVIDNCGDRLERQ